MLFCHLLTFFQILSETLSECLTGCIQISPEVVMPKLGLICLQRSSVDEKKNRCWQAELKKQNLHAG